MKYALFSVPVGTIYDLPQTIKEGEEGLVSTIGDEGLYGQACQVRTAPGGVTAAGVRLPPDVAEVVSFYGYHGYVDRRELQFVREEELWEYLGADLVLVGRAADVLSLPKVQGVRMMELERGGVLRRQPETAEEAEAHKGWAKVLLTDGRTGYVRDVALEPVKYEMTAVFSQREGLAFNDALAETLDTTAEKLVPEAVARWYGGSEDAFRAAVCEQAKKYMGTEYRWGGKSGRGIDCSGLVSSAYMQCGVLIYRDAKIVEGWPMHEVAFENKKPGDALFFPGHVALYLGEGRYIHSTGAAASGGVVINSLESSDPLYREDLLNFVVFFLMTRNYRKISPSEIRRKQKFKSNVKAANAQKIKIGHHRCAVCGRTEKDDPNLEFRYCSKCEGGLEYCMDHLYTHKHVTKEDLEKRRED